MYHPEPVPPARPENTRYLGRRHTYLGPIGDVRTVFCMEPSNNDLIIWQMFMGKIIGRVFPEGAEKYNPLPPISISAFQALYNQATEVGMG